LAYTPQVGGSNIEPLQNQQKAAEPREKKTAGFQDELNKFSRTAAAEKYESEELDGVEDENALSEEKVEEGGGGLGDMDSEAFLQLLVTQMQHQDPMGGEDQDPNQFVTQVTILSLLEQVIQLQDAMEAQEGYSQDNQMLNLLNREVELKDEAGELISGVVSQVDLESNEITVEGETYPFSAVERIKGGQ